MNLGGFVIGQTRANAARGGDSQSRYLHRVFSHPLISALELGDCKRIHNFWVLTLRTKLL